ncbi:hypothetical protein Tco_0543304 [Tanacetum coccineum]
MNIIFVADNMADENIPAPAPTRSDDQILPFVAAFTASDSVPAIYIQRFWNTLTYVEKAGTYRFQLDENWFTLDANLLREALEITPIDQAHLFVTPPSGDAIMDFVNELGYPQTSGHDRPKYPVLRMLWGIITSINADFAELMWEEFVQAIQTFLLIRPIWEVLLIRRSTSPFHLAEEDLRLGNLKFVPKGEEDEVFGMPIPNELISNNIRNARYYNAYLEMIAKHDQKVAAKKEGKKKSARTKQPKPKPAIEKSSKPAPTPKLKVTKEKTSKASTAKPLKPKTAKEKSTKLVDKPDEEPAHSESEPEPEQEGASEEYDMKRAIQMIEGKGKAIVTEEQAAQALLAPHTLKRRSTTNQFILQRRTSTTEEASTGPSAQPQDDTSANILRDSPSPADAETRAESDKTNIGGDTEILQIAEELGEDVTNQVNLEEKTAKLDQDQVGSDPGESLESRPQPEQVHMDEDQARPDPEISCVALAGPDPKPTHEEFMADLYPKDVYAIGDQFINDKSTYDEPGKLNLEAEVVSMVTVLIYQASSSVPPLSTPVIDLSPPKPASSTTQTPIFTATTTKKTTPLPHPP